MLRTVRRYGSIRFMKRQRQVSPSQTRGNPESDSGKKSKVFVGLSGGVDSSVSAALLKKAGYEVTGVFIKGWHPDWGPCGWQEDRLDAMRVCAHLGIPFRDLDLSREYKKEVVDYMVAEYRAGRTPNPDVMCNKHIKFGAFFDWALKQGADYIATGHYARVRKAPSSKLQAPNKFQVSKLKKVTSHKLQATSFSRQRERPDLFSLDPDPAGAFANTFSGGWSDQAGSTQVGEKIRFADG